MAINFSIDDVFGRKGRRDRRKEAATIGQELLTAGVDPATVNLIAKKYIQTGEYEVPTETTKMLPAIDENGPRSTRVPFSMKKKKKFYGYNTKSGLIDELQTDDDVDDVSIKSYTPAEQDDGWDIYVDHMGNEVRRERNNGRSNKTIKLAKPGSGASSADERAAHDTHKRYLAAVQKGQVPADLQAEMESAAPILGMTLEDIPGAVKKPGLINSVRKAFGANVPEEREPGYKLPVFRDREPAAGGAGGGNSEYERDLELAKRAIAAGKVTKEEAIKRLRAKYPNGGKRK